jgi:hypothetical protein
LEFPLYKVFCLQTHPGSTTFEKKAAKLYQKKGNRRDGHRRGVEKSAGCNAHPALFWR